MIGQTEKRKMTNHAPLRLCEIPVYAETANLRGDRRTRFPTASPDLAHITSTVGPVKVARTVRVATCQAQNAMSGARRT